VSSNIWKAEASITSGSLHHPDFAWPTGEAEAWDTTG
jgi:hypothetical protein